MATITTRNIKGSPLSFTELDANFTNLNTAKYEASASPIFGAITATGGYTGTSCTLSGAATVASVTASSEISTAGLRNTSKLAIPTNSLTTLSLTTQNTYLTGTTAGASLAVAFPTADASLDGKIYTFMSTIARPGTTFSSAGATFVPPINASTLTANTPWRYQYDHTTTKWYIC